MRTIEILGANRFPEHTKKRVACRGVVLSGEKILLTYEVNTDQYFIPGGGLEENESLEECCIRELVEETGYVVKPMQQYLLLGYIVRPLFCSKEEKILPRPYVGHKKG